MQQNDEGHHSSHVYVTIPAGAC